MSDIENDGTPDFDASCERGLGGYVCITHESFFSHTEELCEVKSSWLSPADEGDDE